MTPILQYYFKKLVYINQQQSHYFCLDGVTTRWSCPHLSGLDLCFLSLDERGWYAHLVFLRRDEMLPERGHEHTCILAIQEASQVDLHVLRIRMLKQPIRHRHVNYQANHLKAETQVLIE